MAEYIERDTLINAIRNDCAPFTVSMVYRHIRNAPAAEVEPVRHGRWQNKKSPWSQGGYMMACSYCHESIASLSGKLKFCPNCGAKMDWEDEK